jgi:AcrR family transcriptional regulator
MPREKLEIDIEELLQHNGVVDQSLNDKQRTILETAGRLFGDCGYNETTTAQIAREAGVTERTLFKYFHSKSELFKRILLPIVLKFIAPVQFKQIRELTEKEYDSYADFLRAFFFNRANAACAHGPRARILFQELVSDEKFRQQFVNIASEHVFQPMTHFIQRMQKQGKIRNDIDAAIVFRTQLTTILGYMLTRFIFSHEQDHSIEKQEIEQMVAVLTQGLEPDI